MWPSATPATSHAKRKWMWASATPATQNEGGCLQVPRLPHKTKVDVTKCHACHAKRRRMLPSAAPATQSAATSPATNPVQARHQSQPSALSTTPATQNEGGCRQVPGLPCKTKVDVTKCHACHVKRRYMSLSAMFATWNEDTCRKVPRLPRKVTRRNRRLIRSKRATRASPVPKVPRLTHKTKVDVSKCQACHTKRRWMSPSATRATQNEGICH